MIIGSYSDLRVSGKFKAGDTIWACAFDMQHNKEAMHLVSKPVKGMILADRNEKRHLQRMSEPGGDQRLSYFVPFKKDGTPSWSKVVALSSRYYATTEEDCIELYNKKVARYISWLDEQIVWARKQLVEEE